MSVPIEIAVIGSINLDFIIRTKIVPTIGETIGEGSFTTVPGGKGANVAVAAQRLGARVSLWGCVGADQYADAALALARQSGVDLSHITPLDDHPTGVAFINVSDTGENQIAVASGANMAFTPAQIGNLAVDAIITQFEIPQPVIRKAVKTAQTFVCINASPVGPPLAPLLPFVDLIIVNEHEYQFYHAELRHFSGLVAVTLGEKGAKLLQSAETIATAAPPQIDVIDTTGAGDSFAAALTVAILEQMPLPMALQFACNVGALTTTKAGAQDATPYRLAVDKIR